MAKTNRADNSQRCSHTSDIVNAMITLNISHLISIFSFDRWRRLDRYYYHHLKKEKTESQMGPLCQAGAELGLEPGPPPSAPALTLRKRLENTWNQGSLCLVDLSDSPTISTPTPVQIRLMAQLNVLPSGEEAIGTTSQEGIWRRHEFNSTGIVYAWPRKEGHPSPRLMRAESTRDQQKHEDREFNRQSNYPLSLQTPEL